MIATDMSMDDLKEAIRREQPKWAFLTEMLSQHDYDRPTFGVTPYGLVLVNPSFAERIGVAKMVQLIRQELRIANELRGLVRFMK